MEIEGLKFNNFTDEDFTHSYGGNFKTIPANSHVYMEKGAAMLFAKHLADRELNKKDKLENLQHSTSLSNVLLRKEIMDKILDQEEVVTESEIIEENIKAKKVKKAKVKKEVVEEEEFSDLIEE